MKHHTAAAMGARLVLAGLCICVATTQADEIDEILKIERMADEDVLAVGQLENDLAATSSQADGQASSRSRDVDLQQARNEIARLQRALIDQELAHQAEMQRSYYNMGCVYKASRQYERAESEFLKVLAISPNDAATHYNLAILYDDDLNNKAKAREHYRKFLELAPDDKDAPIVQEWLEALARK
ncbi:MAG: tetratricopeptide repeat protein [Verrucomicrobia bacterium]|nr:tetratricopeptide repeat protein [Verrucomicrobiota bacterium]